MLTFEFQTYPNTNLETRVSRAWVNRVYAWNMDLKRVLKKVSVEPDRQIAIFDFNRPENKGCSAFHSTLSFRIRAFDAKHVKKTFRTRTNIIEKIHTPEGIKCVVKEKGV